MPIQKEEKTIWKVITTIEKKFLNHLINHVEELENVCLSKLIFKFEKKKNEILKYYEKKNFFQNIKTGKANTHVFENR